MRRLSRRGSRVSIFAAPPSQSVLWEVKMTVQPTAVPRTLRNPTKFTSETLGELFATHIDIWILGNSGLQRTRVAFAKICSRLITSVIQHGQVVTALYRRRMDSSYRLAIKFGIQGTAYHPVVPSQANWYLQTSWLTLVKTTRRHVLERLGLRSFRLLPQTTHLEATFGTTQLRSGARPPLRD
jgi:hypothetical protein